jgi:hypothetical protein
MAGAILVAFEAVMLAIVPLAAVLSGAAWNGSLQHDQRGRDPNRNEVGGCHVGRASWSLKRREELLSLLHLNIGGKGGIPSVDWQFRLRIAWSLSCRR